jgi:hypothetical protein
MLSQRHWVVALAALVASHADVHALNAPSESDGPIRLLNCVVSAGGSLEAELDNQSDDAMNCNIRCNYELGGQMFYHWFELTIPKRFTGRLGQFDTNGARAGNYSGDVGTCKKTAARGP